MVTTLDLANRAPKKFLLRGRGREGEVGRSLTRLNQRRVAGREDSFLSSFVLTLLSHAAESLSPCSSSS